jgi:hypothetical protein
MEWLSFWTCTWATTDVVNMMGPDNQDRAGDVGEKSERLLFGLVLVRGKF